MNPDPAARGIRQDVCLVLPGAFKHFDAIHRVPIYSQVTSGSSNLHP